MPAQQSLNAAGPFVHSVLHVDGGIAGGIRISAMEHFSAAIVQRREIFSSEKSIRDTIEELVTWRRLRGCLQRNRIEIGVNLLHKPKHASRIPFGRESGACSGIFLAIGGE